jgi:hypothetical protein
MSLRSARTDADRSSPSWLASSARASTRSGALLVWERAMSHPGAELLLGQPHPLLYGRAHSVHALLISKFERATGLIIIFKMAMSIPVRSRADLAHPRSDIDPRFHLSLRRHASTIRRNRIPFKRRSQPCASTGSRRGVPSSRSSAWPASSAAAIAARWSRARDPRLGRRTWLRQRFAARWSSAWSTPASSAAAIAARWSPSSRSSA